MIHTHRHDPWFRQETYGDELPQAIANALSSSATERGYELLRACIMAFAYERDRYTGLDLRGAPGQGRNGLLTRLHHDSRIMDNRSTPWINKIKSAVDVVADKVLQGLPTLAVRSSNARFEDLRLHEIRSRALNAEMQDPESEQELYLWTRDGLIKRVGFIRAQYRDGRLSLERLHPWQVHYDLKDSLKGRLSQVHTVQLVDRDEWLSWYAQARAVTSKGTATKIPNHTTRIQEIRALPTAHAFLPAVTGFDGAWMGAYRWLLDEATTYVADQIRVVWSYKRAWRAGEPTGRVVCTVLGNHVRDSVIALDVPFRRSTLPIVHWAPWRADVGITGISLAEQLIGAQMVTDQTLFKMARLQQKYGHPKVFYEEGAIGDEALKALLAAGVHMVAVKGGEEPPKMVPGLQLSQSDIAWLNLAMDRPASEQGVTPALSQGRSQLGPNASGVSRLEERFQALDRQQGVRDAHTRAYRQLGAEVLNTLDDALQVDKGIKARWPTKVAGQFRERPWAELRLANGEYWLDVDERGELGTTRSGRIQRALELHDRGFLNRDSVQELLFSNADIDAAGARQIAGRRAIEAHLEVLLDPKTTSNELAEVQPTEDMDLEDAAFLVTALINQAIAHQAGPETLLRLRSYLAAVSATRANMQQQAALGAVPTPTPPQV